MLFRGLGPHLRADRQTLTLLTAFHLASRLALEIILSYFYP